MHRFRIPVLYWGNSHDEYNERFIHNLHTTTNLLVIKLGVRCYFNVRINLSLLSERGGAKRK